MIVDEELAEQTAGSISTDDDDDDLPAESVTTALLPDPEADVNGLSRRDLKRLERQKKRDEKKQSRKNKQRRECADGDKKCCMFPVTVLVIAHVSRLTYLKTILVGLYKGIDQNSIKPSLLLTGWCHVVHCKRSVTLVQVGYFTFLVCECGNTQG